MGRPDSGLRADPARVSTTGLFPQFLFFLIAQPVALKLVYYPRQRGEYDTLTVLARCWSFTCCLNLDRICRGQRTCLGGNPVATFFRGYRRGRETGPGCSISFRRNESGIRRALN